MDFAFLVRFPIYGNNGCESRDYEELAAIQGMRQELDSQFMNHSSVDCSKEK